MPGSLQSRSPGSDARSGAGTPDVSVCESRPGKLVFLEAGNTDGWIATDVAVELTQ